MDLGFRGRGRKNIKRAFEAGVKVAFGTDCRSLSARPERARVLLFMFAWE